MLRAFVCASVALVLCVNVGQAADGKEMKGVVKKIDADKGVLTVTVKVKKESMDKEFTIADTTKFIITEGDEKKEMTGKSSLKSLKEGDHVGVIADGDKASEVHVGATKKKQHK